MSIPLERSPLRGAATATLLLGLLTAACNDPAASTPSEGQGGASPRSYAPPPFPDVQLPAPNPGPGPSPYFMGGVVSTSESVASRAGRKVLESGGDAIDAAVVVQAVLSVAEPQASGLGGGALWLIYLADPGKTLVIDCRERAPAKATPNMFVGTATFDLKSTSGIAVGVPGALHCMTAALALRPGGRTLAEALQPALDLAERGIIVSERLAEDTRSPRLTNEPGRPAYEEARAVFRPGGDGLFAGARLKQPELAQTLETLQTGGLAAFYDCDHPAGIAAAIVATQKSRRTAYPAGAGRMACADLLAFKPAFTAPLTGTYRGYTIVTTPPPSSGVSLLQMLATLERFDIGEGEYGFGQLLTMNVMQEIMRQAFADRSMWLGDPDFVDVPVHGLLSGGYVSQRAGLIVPGVRQDDVDPGDPRLFDIGQIGATLPAEERPTKLEGTDTTHYVISDGQGNLVSVTTTVTDKWGTGLMVPGFGFLLNNQLLNFNEEPTYSDKPFDPGANDVAPFKRPRTALVPTLVLLGGKPIAALGSPGGGALLNAVFGFLVDLIDHRMSLQEAVAAPRFSLTSSNDPWDTEIELGFNPLVRAKLAKLGYDFTATDAIGAVQAVIINQKDGRKYGTADPRRNGAVEGLGD